MSTSTIEEVETKVRKLPPYNLILLNDDDHTVEYVVALCQAVCGHTREKGLRIAEEVHVTGRSIIFTGSLELAELKQEQVHSMGPDRLIPRCKGSMSAVIEPAS